MLCATEDDAQPMICVQQTFPFEHTVEIQNGEQVADWQIFLCQDQLLVAMLDARELGDEGSAAGAGYVHQNGDAAGGGASGGTAP